jgi:hypothetical protein
VLVNIFYQYQENEHPSLFSNDWAHDITYGIGNPGPVLEQAQKCGWVKPACSLHKCVLYTTIYGNKMFRNKFRWGVNNTLQLSLDQV